MCVRVFVSLYMQRLRDMTTFPHFPFERPSGNGSHVALMAVYLCTAMEVDRDQWRPRIFLIGSLI